MVRGYANKDLTYHALQTTRWQVSSFVGIYVSDAYPPLMRSVMVGFWMSLDTSLWDVRHPLTSIYILEVSQIIFLLAMVRLKKIEH